MSQACRCKSRKKCELKKESTTFHWSERREQSFNKLKELLTRTQDVAYFDPEKEIELLTYASPTGIVGNTYAEFQNSDDKKVVTYASRTLTPVERSYLQTEWETLAIVWAIENTSMIVI